MPLNVWLDLLIVIVPFVSYYNGPIVTTTCDATQKKINFFSRMNTTTTTKQHNLMTNTMHIDQETIKKNIDTRTSYN